MDAEIQSAKIDERPGVETTRGGSGGGQALGGGSAAGPQRSGVPKKRCSISIARAARGGICRPSWVTGMPFTCASDVGRRAASGSVCGKICKPSPSPKPAVCSWIPRRCGRISTPPVRQKKRPGAGFGTLSRRVFHQDPRGDPRRKLRRSTPPHRRPGPRWPAI